MPVDNGQPLPGQNQHGRTVRSLDRSAPGSDGFVGVGRPQDHEVRHHSQRGQVLDRLVRGPVFAHADGIVRHDVNDGQPHQRSQSDCRSRVIGEYEERSDKRAQTAVQGHAGGHGTHHVFANAEGDVPAGSIFFGKIGRALQQRLIRRRQIGASPHHPRNLICQDIERLSRSRAGGYGAVSGRKLRQRVFPVFRQPAFQSGLESGREIRVAVFVNGETLLPGFFQLLAAPHGLSHVRKRRFRNAERLIFRPAVGAFGKSGFFGAQRGTVRVGRVLLVWRAKADVRPQQDQ